MIDYGWVRALLTDCLSQWLTEWLSQWVNDWLSDWLSDWVSEWTDEWLTEWLSEWVNEWLNDWPSDWLAESVAVSQVKKKLNFYYLSKIWLLESPKEYNKHQCVKNMKKRTSASNIGMVCYLNTGMVCYFRFAWSGSFKSEEPLWVPQL